MASQLVVCEAMYVQLYFTQTLPPVLCANAIGHVSFLDLCGPIAGATNPITWHFYGKFSYVTFIFFLDRTKSQKTSVEKTNQTRSQRHVHFEEYEPSPPASEQGMYMQHVD